MDYVSWVIFQWKGLEKFLSTYFGPFFSNFRLSARQINARSAQTFPYRIQISKRKSSAKILFSYLNKLKIAEIYLFSRAFNVLRGNPVRKRIYVPNLGVKVSFAGPFFRNTPAVCVNEKARC